LLGSARFRLRRPLTAVVNSFNRETTGPAKFRLIHAEPIGAIFASPVFMKITLSFAIIAIALSAIACGSSSPSSPTPTSGADVTVNIVGINGSNSFAPNPTTVAVGQRIAWKNADSTTHDIIQDANAFTTASVGAGATTNAVTMSTRGTFTYHCGIHPTMVGTVTVQ
jgi:plastocyanin